MTELSLHFPQSEKNFDLEDDAMTAGRSLKASNLDLRPYFKKGDTSLISKKHFKIIQQKRPDKFFIVDLKSKNGTELNGQPLTKNSPAPLDHGDKIRLAGNDHFLIKVIISNGGTDEMPKPKSGVYFDRSRAQFMVDGRPIPYDRLAPLEKKLLEYLYQNAGKACSNDELIREVWLGAEVQEGAVTGAISKLRKKLKRLSAKGEHYIERVTRRGYKLQKAT